MPNSWLTLRFTRAKNQLMADVVWSRNSCGTAVILQQPAKALSATHSAYCLAATLKHRLQVHAPSLTPRAVLEKLAAVQTLDVWLPTTDGRYLVMPRYTEPETDLALLLHQLNLVLPKQPLPRLVGAPPVAIPKLKM